jgi:hypothetical protein
LTLKTVLHGNVKQRIGPAVSGNVKPQDLTLRGPEPGKADQDRPVEEADVGRDRAVLDVDREDANGKDLTLWAPMGSSRGTGMASSPMERREASLRFR